ncbi:YegS/Rv2252/BmrU family lipid kinase [Alkalibaculum sp. M08DMB]|uniref:YegS/Rv2252/BmrU family lipid kinase n=1 Tax=Alkalibaculum sporogenes TaxID=2655001 RepID=A0A6A7KD13_9FIRM|nr:diacylglycerol kinase family protein [Alkalibaculum sporogenes]MPW26883.1 YegS/Rv2252/BmrU family lipid kinase [Alkalibaculum sporogenes]
MNIFFIVNPVAGKGKSKDLIPFIESACKENKVNYKIEISNGEGSVKHLAKQAVSEGYKKVIAVGGDGTINEVVNGIVGYDAALGIIPGGSGNDFLRSISNNSDPLNAIQDVIHGTISKIDLGLCNNRYFINVGSVGIDAEVVIRTETTKKIFSGSLAYIAAALYTIFTYKGWNLRIDIDNHIIQGKTLLTAVANGKYYGGGIMPAPKAKIDDGYYDLCHISHMSKLKMFSVFPKYIKGTHSNIKEVTFIKGKQINITCDTPFAINLDGEIMIDTKADFSIIHQGIDVIFPKSK